MSVIPRLHRLFTAKGKCLQVALDHGLANEFSTLTGMENMKEVVGVVAAANPDAMILTLGQAHWLQDLPQKPKPALVVRADAMNVYALPTPQQVFCKFIDDAVEQAVALDAAAIVVNLFWMSEHPDLHRQCLENIVHFKPRCERYGMPLIVEPMALIPSEKGGFKTHSDIGRTVALARLAVELGADVVKADIDENLEEYHQVVEACSPRPMLPRGGPRVPDREILTRTHALIQQGASGIVYGRNVYQHPHPARMVRALQALVHDGATVAQAMAILE
jgi:DhnA family fructose-bisphosphate aldolase class Ia